MKHRRNTHQTALNYAVLPVFESMEERRLLAATVVQSGTDLIITGTSADNTLSVTRSTTNLKAVADGTVYTFNNASIDHIYVNGQTGDDLITVNSYVTKPLDIDGGDGSDIFQITGTTGANSFSFATTTATLPDSNIAAYTNFEKQLIDGRGGDDIVAVGASAEVTFAHTQRLASLTLAAGAKVNLDANSATTVFIKSVPILGGGAFINVNDNALIIDYTGGTTPYPVLKAQVMNGLALLGGSQTDGIGNLDVDLQTVGGTILSIVDNGSPDIDGGISSRTFAASIPHDCVIVMYTWFGDANLDGLVDGGDYALTDTGFLDPNLTGWVFGDFDFDGTAATSGDYALLDSGFMAQIPNSMSLWAPSPTNVTATAISSIQAKLEWTAPATPLGEDDYYMILASEDGGNYQLFGTTTNTTYQFYSPFKGKVQFKVAAHVGTLISPAKTAKNTAYVGGTPGGGGGGGGAEEEEETLTLEAAVEPPGVFTVEQISTTKVVLSWSAGTGLVETYSIWISVDDGDFELFDTVPDDVFSYDFFADISGTYRFRIIANGPDGVQSIWTSGTWENPDGSDSGIEADPDMVASVLAAPTGLTLSSTPYTDNVELEWDAVPDADGYLVQWTNDGEIITLDDVSGTSYTDEYPALGVQSYQVTAYRGNTIHRFSSPSSPLSVHPIAPPVAWQDNNRGETEQETVSRFTTNHDTSLPIDLLGNDLDYESQTIWIDWLGDPENGILDIDIYGNLIYTPNEGFVGIDSFEYKIKDSQINSAPAKAVIDVINFKPVPAHLEFNDVTPKGKTGFLSATDKESDEITYELEEAPHHGSVVIDPLTGEFVYTASDGYQGFDTFTYTADDGVGDAEPESVMVMLISQTHIVPSSVFTDMYTIVSVGGLSDEWMLLSEDLPGGFQLKKYEGIDENDQPIYSDIEPDTWYTGFYPVVIGNGDPEEVGKLSFKLRYSAGWESKPFEINWRNGGYGVHDFEGGSQNHFVLPMGEVSDHVGNIQFYGPGLISPDHVELDSDAAHGSVVINDDYTFTYTPNELLINGDIPYIGWDFFTVTVETEQWGTLTQTVQLVLGGYSRSIPTLNQLPLMDVMAPGASTTASRGAAAMGAPSFNKLKEDLEATQGKLRDILNNLKILGEGVGHVASATDLEILAKLDTATGVIDTLYSDYNQYIVKLIALNKSAGDFMASQWYVSDADKALVDDINKLPYSVGALKASKDLMEQMAVSLESLGKGAAVAVDTANAVVYYAETTHAVLSTVEMAGGVTVLVKTGATLLVKEGIKACAKAAAKELAQNVGGAVAANLAGRVAEYLGIPEEQRQYIAVGLNAFQVFSFLKAAKSKVNWNGNCFAAGTNVIVGQNADGTPVTRPIEEIGVGDTVLSRDQYDSDDDIESHLVTQVFRKTSDHLRILTIRSQDGNVEIIKTTDEHPFWVEGKGWTAAKDLKIEDELVQPDGSFSSLLSSNRESHSEGIAVFNFEVQGDHTYFVEDGQGVADAVWVHNLCVANTFFGRHKGKPISFEGVPTGSKRLSKVTKAQYDAIELDFKNRARPAFLKDLAATERNNLKKLGFSDKEIDQMSIDGMLPGWAQNGPRKLEVHHIHPKDVGGTNDPSNLILIRQSPHHTAISKEVEAFTAHMERGDGQIIEMDLPTFGGMKIYDP